MKHPEAVKPFTQPKPLADGLPRCRWCWGTITAKRRESWCGDACVAEYRLEHDWTFIRRQVEKRDRGVCRICSTDTIWLRAVALQRRAHMPHAEWRAFCLSILNCPTYRDPWEADHIKPRHDGGSDHPDNLRTLCIRCHKRVTTEFAKERARRRRNGEAPMNILGIDPGTSCGWALRHRDGRIIASGTWDLSPKRHEGGGMRFVRLRTYLRDTLPECEMVAYEEVRRHMGVDAAHIYGGIVAMIAAECEARKLPYTALPVASIKKHATGSGNPGAKRKGMPKPPKGAGKLAMMTAAKDKWPQIELIDDNHADALWIADLAGTLYGDKEVKACSV